MAKLRVLKSQFLNFGPGNSAIILFLKTARAHFLKVFKKKTVSAFLFIIHDFIMLEMTNYFTVKVQILNLGSQ